MSLLLKRLGEVVTLVPSNLLTAFFSVQVNVNKIQPDGLKGCLLMRLTDDPLDHGEG